MAICKKLKNKVIFFLILVGIAGINVYYQLTSPFKTHDKEISMKVYDSRNISLKATKNFANRVKEFKHLNQIYCDPRAKELDITCLEKLSEFDEKISKVDGNTSICDKCLRLNNKNLTIFHHTFWQLNEIKSDTSQFYKRTIFLNIMSYLATQNLCCTKFLFWKLREFPVEIEEEIRKTFKYYIDKHILEIKVFDFKELCSNKHSSFKNTYVCNPTNNENLANQHLISLSDLVRFMVLDVYGGIYTDGDVVYLKEMSLLWNHNFAYRWSYTDNYNTAVLGINKYLNPSISQLYEKILRSDAHLNTLINAFHPHSLSNLVRLLNKNSVYDYEPLKTYHSFLFDPAWTCFDGVIKRLKPELVCGFDEFNNKKMIEDESMFNPKMHPTGGGSFTYHLHLANCGSSIRDDSYFKYFENYYNSLLKHHLKN
jgi:hypothetical protein